jgi:hypothetical protein
VTAFRAALMERTAERELLAWAKTQSNLGNVLTTLGGHEASVPLGDLKVDTARLEEAVTAYRAALTVGTRKQVPLQ